MIEDLTEYLLEAKALVSTEPDEALRMCSEIMNQEIDTEIANTALFLSGFIMLNAERFGMAYNIFQRCAQLTPKKAQIWINMGVCLEDIDQNKALKFFKKAQTLDKTNPNAFVNEGLIHMKRGNPEKCIALCEKGLKLDEYHKAAIHNISLSKLMLKDWSGWKDWNDTLGVMGRTAIDYGLPDWDGKSTGKLLIYGEQGVGDEIMYASILEELAESHEIVFDTDKRLQKLLSRTFDFPVYGTRFESNSPVRLDHEFDYQIAIGQLPLFFRSEGKFPGKPYLKPNPDQKIMYRALFDTYPGKKIGVAWSGGGNRTGIKKRTMSIDDLIPLFNQVDNTFISLEYNPVKTKKLEQYNIKHFDCTGKGKDIDELAAMISQLDMVVTACTTVVYIAGALGIPCYVLVPSEPGYRYHLEGDFPWYDSVELIRQEKGQSWAEVVQKAVEIVDEFECIHRIRPERDSSLSRVCTVNHQTLIGTSELHPCVLKPSERIHSGT